MVMNKPFNETKHQHTDTHYSHHKSILIYNSMSLCRHQTISNIIITYTQWFNTSGMTWEMTDRQNGYASLTFMRGEREKIRTDYGYANMSGKDNRRKLLVVHILVIWWLNVSVFACIRHVFSPLLTSSSLPSSWSLTSLTGKPRERERIEGEWVDLSFRVSQWQDRHNRLTTLTS